jgi:uncharacterized membrane protein
MDIVVKLLFWVHLMSLAAGGAATFGIPVVGRQMRTAGPEMRPVLQSILKGLSNVGRTGIGLLIITGPLMIWLKYGGFGGVSYWFWIKMALVVALLAGVVYGGILFERSTKGDMAAGQMMPRVGMINMILLLGIVLSAVFAFE